MAIVPVILFSFQNCAPKSFVAGTDETGRPVDPQECAPPSDCPVDPTKPFDLLTHTIRTEMNTPKDWSAPYDGVKDPYHISLANNSDKNTLDIPDKGSVEILDPQTFALRFVPEIGYRGTLVIWLYALDDKGVLKSSVEVKIDVGNSLNHFQPALAVRGAGCVMCHADVRSNIVTDMGYGSGFFFARNVNTSGYSWNLGSTYGDFEAFTKSKEGTNRIGNWANLQLKAGQQVFIPKNAALPVQDAKDKTGASTLKGYLEHRFAASPKTGTASAIVTEKSKVYIGAPTASRIRGAFNWVSGQSNFIYEKDAAAGALGLRGLRDAGKYFEVDNTLECDGDLMINGRLLLKNAKIRTHNGCRLYVTGSVYIYGPISYVNITNGSLHNLQITSAASIQMGLGSLRNSSNRHCEEGKPAGQDWYWQRLQTIDTDYYLGSRADYEKALNDTAINRLKHFWPNIYHNTRDARAVATVNNELYNEYYNSVYPQYDAACSNRAVSYERLLLNAPRIESRYNGNFHGSIIAEVAIMALGQFKFEFDDVFKQVPILPKFTDDDYLKIE